MDRTPLKLSESDSRKTDETVETDRDSRHGRLNRVVLVVQILRPNAGDLSDRCFSFATWSPLRSFDLSQKQKKMWLSFNTQKFLQGLALGSMQSLGILITERRSFMGPESGLPSARSMVGPFYPTHGFQQKLSFRPKNIPKGFHWISQIRVSCRNRKVWRFRPIENASRG